MARGRPRKSGQEVLVKSAEFIGWALGGLEREIAQTRERLSTLNAEAAKMRAKVSKGVSSSAAALAQPASRRRMSAEARKRISEAMKKRWAARKVKR
jgi:hypothetical protein